MTGSRRWWVVGGLIVSVGLIGQGVFFLRVGLQDADRWASVIGSFVGVAGLVVSFAGLVVAFRSPASAGGQHAGQVVGDNYQAGSVTGNVRIGRRRGRPAPLAGGVPPSPSTAGSGDGQSVGHVGGDNVQLGSTGGDLEIDRD
ncbi:hypothetical protein [Actinomadura formosensis]|uniref:hypothetical protein n=1 Tax=Actinomadura formosensis TaxID=60706 RepID=UPI003D920C6C